MTIHFKKEERQLLFKKYVGNGMSYDEADYQLKKNIKDLNDIIDRERKKKKSELDIQEVFAREFDKLVNE